MCISAKEMNQAMEEIKSLKMLIEEAEGQIKALEREVITFFEETKECQTVDKKGNSVLKFIGNSRKATYSFKRVSWQRESERTA